MAKKIIEIDPYASLRCCTRVEALKLTDGTKKKLKCSNLNTRNLTIKYSGTNVREVEQALYDAAKKNGIQVNIKQNVFVSELPDNAVIVKF